MNRPDTMTEAIALSSPSGRMSKHARKAAERRLATELFPPELFPNGLKGPPPKQPTKKERCLHWAAELRALADRGMCPRKYRAKADRLEARARSLP